MISSRVRSDRRPDRAEAPTFARTGDRTRYPALAAVTGPPPRRKETDASVTAITTANVATAFDEAADRYDLMVGLNPGYHDHLRSAAEALAERLPRPSGSNGSAVLRLADLGCGSGASTRHCWTPPGGSAYAPPSSA